MKQLISTALGLLVLSSCGFSIDGNTYNKVTGQLLDSNQQVLKNVPCSIIAYDSIKYWGSSEFSERMLARGQSDANGFIELYYPESNGTEHLFVSDYTFKSLLDADTVEFPRHWRIPMNTATHLAHLGALILVKQ